MIGSFADRTLENLYYLGPSMATKRIPADLHGAIRRRLAYLHNAANINVSRRTVAKYRVEMGIPAAAARRR